MPTGDTLFIPIGHRCSSAALLDRCNLASESLPFDSIVCQLGVVRDCLEHGFNEFLDAGNYVKVDTMTANFIDGAVDVWGYETPSINLHYEDTRRPGESNDLTNRSTYHLRLALTHHDLARAEDQETFCRRIGRLHHVLQRSGKKVCVYIHPILGGADYERQRTCLIDTFASFGEFMRSRFANISGLFFILVKLGDGDDPEMSRRILKDDACSVYVIFVNPRFVDAGGPFEGSCEREIKIMMDIIQQADP
jgi:putative papain-like cysteine peptidase DUF1796